MYTQLTIKDINENEVLAKVWDLVCNAHAGQTRKGLSQPCHTPGNKSIHPEYVTHPFRAMEIVANALGNPKEVLKDKKHIPILAAALAHDAIEDTDLNRKITLARALVPIMGVRDACQTAFLVQELSNPPEGFPGKTKKERDAAKKVWQSKHAKTMSFKAKMVKMADQIANTIDCVDIFMLKPNDKGEYEPLWTREKKDSYIEKAAAVCDACMVGTEKASPEEQIAFKKLLSLENKAYNYAQTKLENAILCGHNFFNKLGNGKPLPDPKTGYIPGIKFKLFLPQKTR